MVEPSNVIVKQEKDKKTAMNTVKVHGGGGGGIGVGIIFLGGAVATAAFLFITRRRKPKSNSSKTCKKSQSAAPSSMEIPYKVIEDKFINEDKGLRFVAAANFSSSTHLDMDQELRNGTSSSSGLGMHDENDHNPMVSDVTTFFLDEKEKLQVNGRKEDAVPVVDDQDDIHIMQLPVVDDQDDIHIMQSDESFLMKKEIPTPTLVEETTSSLQPAIPEDELAIKEENTNGPVLVDQGIEEDCQDMLMKIEGENSTDAAETTRADEEQESPIEGGESIGDLEPKTSDSGTSLSNDENLGNECDDSAALEKDEELEPGNEEEQEINGSNEKHDDPFQDQGNQHDSTATIITRENEAVEVEGNTAIQMPEEEEENLKKSQVALLIGENFEVAEEETEISGSDHQEPQMDTTETSLNSDTDEITSGERSANESNESLTLFHTSDTKPESYADEGFEEIQQSADDLPIQLAEKQEYLDDELKEAEEKLICRQEEDSNDNTDESSNTPEIVDESSEGTADSSAESIAEPIWPAESIQDLSMESEKMAANDSKEISPLPNGEHNNVKKLEDNGIPETESPFQRQKRLDDDKGNLKFMVSLSGSLSTRYFGLRFFKLCFIIILTMIIAKMHGILTL